MALVSRILWTSTLDPEIPPADAIGQVLHSMEQWVFDGEDRALAPGQVQFSRTHARNRGVRTVTCHLLPDDSGVAVEVEDEDPTGNLWGVQIRLVIAANRLMAWVDNTVEQTDPQQRITIGRPRVVDDLLKVGSSPTLGGSALLSEPLTFSAAQVPVLMDYLSAENRTLPIILATCGRTGFSTDDERRHQELAARLTGLGTVVTLDSAAQDAFNGSLPNGFGTWGGAIRVYMPGELGRPFRHRFFPNDQLAIRGINPIVDWVTAMSTRRRPDPLLLAAAKSGRAADSSEDSAELGRLQRQNEELELEYAILQEELAESEGRLAEAQGYIRRLRHAGFNGGRTAEVVQLETGGSDEPADAVSSISEAALQAQIYLDNLLSIPDASLQRLDQLDATPNASAWGNTVWRGLRALASYCEDQQSGGFSGNFKDWCQQHGDWTANDKKLALRESSTVRNNTRLWRARELPVSTELEPSGRLHMEAHLKISEGGGPLAPRVYFYDDSRGITQKIHIGLIGPHYLVPNTKA